MYEGGSNGYLPVFLSLDVLILMQLTCEYGGPILVRLSVLLKLCMI